MVGVSITLKKISGKSSTGTSLQNEDRAIWCGASAAEHLVDCSSTAMRWFNASEWFTEEGLEQNTPLAGNKAGKLLSKTPS